MNFPKRCFLKMLSYSIRRTILFVSFISFLLMGCRVARMEVRPQLVSAAEEMKVKGRWSLGFSKPFSFGSYQVTKVKRGWTQSSGFSIDLPKSKNLSSSKATHKYEFILKDGKEDVWKCKCGTTCDETYIDFSKDKKRRVRMGITKKAFVCTFRAEKKPEVWHLTMSEDYDSSCIMKGILSDGETSFLIQATHKLAGDVWDLGTPSGYEFFIDGKIVGSVEVINNGAVWIIPSLEENHKSPLAVIAAAMLLYLEIGGR